MKPLISLLLVSVFILSSCNSSTTIAPPSEEPDGPPATLTSLPEDTATPTLEPTLTPTTTATATPVPPPAVWSWAVDADSLKVIGVDQFGELREFDTLKTQDSLAPMVSPLGLDRALLFVRSGGLQVYLLTPDGMQSIALGDSLGGIQFKNVARSLDVIASDYEHAVFSLTTESGYGPMPENGPIFWVDVATLSITRVDEKVSRSILNSQRVWFHTSSDGRFLRYISGDETKRSVHELDMTTGETRSIISSPGSPYDVQASRNGEIWYFEDTALVADHVGNQFTFNEPGSSLRILGNGDGLIIPDECEDDCTVQVVDLFADQVKASYQVPWGVQSKYTWAEITRVLPDQSLLIPGAPVIELLSEPALMQEYPLITPENLPLFLLTPDGKYSLIGLYNKLFSEEFMASPDGRYAVLQAVDKTNFFIYDTETGETLMTIPSDPEVDLVAFNTFYENGLLVDLRDWSSEPGSQQNTSVVYSYATGTGATWDGTGSCPTFLNDGTLICWFNNQTNPDNFDITHFDPVSGKRTILLENVWFINEFD